MQQKILALVRVISSSFILLMFTGCEKSSEPTAPRNPTEFSWEYVMDSPSNFHSLQEIPPLALASDGTIWTVGYTGSLSASHRCMARRKMGGSWETWQNTGDSGDYYAYDVAIDPNSGNIFISIKSDPVYEQDGIYVFVENDMVQGFYLQQVTPDPGPFGYSYNSPVIMFTRHINNANSGVYIGPDWTFYSATLPYVSGDVICVATMSETGLAFAITSDSYVLKWNNNQISAEPFPGTLYDIKWCEDLWLCTDTGIYKSDDGVIWTKDDNFPGDKAFSIDFDGKAWILGEKGGEKKVYCFDGNRYLEEPLNYQVGLGRLGMVINSGDVFHTGFIYDNSSLVQREAH